MAQNYVNSISRTQKLNQTFLDSSNLYSFQKYQGYNPDFTSGVLNPGFDFGSYPKPRTFMVGVQLVF